MPRRPACAVQRTTRVMPPDPIPPVAAPDHDGRGVVSGSAAGRGAPAATLAVDGVWRSLVAHSLWERGAVGSNPATPTVVRDCGVRCQHLGGFRAPQRAVPSARLHSMG